MKINNTLASLALVGLCAQGASAALITGATATNHGVINSNVNLTAIGPVDWAVWTGTDTPTSAPSEFKSGGTAISDLTVTLGGTTTYVENNVVHIFYSWTNGGGNNATATDNDPTDPRLTALASADMVGSGSSLSLKVAGSTSERTVTIWGSARNLGGEIVASLGTTSVTNTFANNGNNDAMWSYSVTFEADTIGDLLTLTLNPTGGGTGQERLGIGAVAVIPEPATLGLVAVVGAGLLIARRMVM